MDRESFRGKTSVSRAFFRDRRPAIRAFYRDRERLRAVVESLLDKDYRVQQAVEFTPRSAEIPRTPWFISGTKKNRDKRDPIARAVELDEKPIDPAALDQAQLFVIIQTLARWLACDVALRRKYGIEPTAEQKAAMVRVWSQWLVLVDDQRMSKSAKIDTVAVTLDLPRAFVAEHYSDRLCACGCGSLVSGRSKYVDATHRKRAERNRRKLVTLSEARLLG